MSITKFLKHFLLHWYGGVGKCNTPLDYVIRPVGDVLAVGPNFLTNQVYSTEHGSVEGGLIVWLSFDHPLYQNDNDQVYSILVEGLSGEKYLFRHSTIPPCLSQHRWLWGIPHGEVFQHAEKCAWEAQTKVNDDFIKTRQ